ncbi:MAG: hypothetical protein VKJ64_11625 [Leptolyngbyaceae bacterium]|nr:hypothetical protein [Leptolyngbyaceae bacterium]
MTFNPEFNLADLNGSNGFILTGIDDLDRSGGSVSSAGDINNDGIADLMIGAIGADSEAGEIYVVFGSTIFSTKFDLDDLDGSNGFMINGADSNDLAGTSISDAGDFNNDGIADIIIGAPDADVSDNTDGLISVPILKSNLGETYIVFGSSSSFDDALDLEELDGDDGFRLKGVDEEDLSGSAVSNIGDINNDGIDDVLIGAPDATSSDAGESYVVFGSSSSFDDTVDLQDLDGEDGFVIIGEDSDDLLGSSVSGGGDINGDGIADFIIGAPGADNGAGATYVIFGSSSDFDQSLDLDNLASDEGFVIEGIDKDDASGTSVSSIGDFNGDNIDDLIIGAPNANNGTGETYVIWGSTEDFGSSLELSSLDGTAGFTIRGINDTDFSGGKVSGAGDINGDGLNDIVIGAALANDGVGEAYVVFGSQDNFYDLLELSDLDGDNGFLINGIDTADLVGSSVSGAGDVNGDGVDDLIIGAIGAEDEAGESYVIFGVAGTLGSAFEIDFAGDGETIKGNGDKNKLKGGNKDDILLGKGGNDQLLGNKGNDQLDGGGGNDKLDGSNGQDRLEGKNGDDKLIGKGGKDILVGGKGDDQLQGGGGKDLFTFTKIKDGTDTIKDFSVNEDLIDLRDIFAGSAYLGDTDVLDFERFSQFVDLVIVGSNTEVRVDKDGSGSSLDVVTLAVVKGVTDLSSSNFVIR